jgi:hypothetical protein
VRITEIGEIVEAEGLYMEIDGSLERVEPTGYEHII